MTSFSVITEGVVNVFVTSNCNSFTSEKRFPKDLTVELLKGKLELVTGASSLSMKISALDKNGRLVCNLDKDDAILGSYPVDSGMTLHVEDTNKHRDEFENTENVKKYEMTEEEYSKRTNTVQSFLRRNKLGKYNEEEVKKTEAKKQQAEAEDEEAAAKISVGDRCLVKASCCGTRRGCVKYVGKTDFKPGWWVGVQYDEPYGKHDGTVGGKQYFSCPDKYGGFVRVSQVETGDFPEETIDLSDDEM